MFNKSVVIVHCHCVISVFVIFPGISGERIWVELKKIAIGNHASDILTTMLDVGLAPVVGQYVTQIRSLGHL